MTSAFTEESSYLRPALLFVGCLLVLWVMPWVGLCLRSEFLYFAPQYLFPYEDLFVKGQHHPKPVLLRQEAMLLSVLQWGLAGVCFVVKGRYLRLLHGLLAAFVFIALVGLITNLALVALGLSVVLEP